jgi:hypothetical protein
LGTAVSEGSAMLLASLGCLSVLSPARAFRCISGVHSPTFYQPPA